MTTYYVATNGNNANNGSIGSPWGTLQYALGQMGAGDTLLVRGGTYNQRVHPADGTLPIGSSWSSPITVSGYPAETAIITGGFGLQDNLNFSVLQYWRIQNLSIRNTHAEAVLVAGNTAHVEILNCDLQTFGSPSVVGFCMIVQITQTTDNVRVAGCVVHDAPVSLASGGGNVTYGNYGFYINGDHMTIENNVVRDNAGVGINLYRSGGADADNNVIRNNRVHGNGFDDGTRGLIQGGIVCFSGSHGYVYNNAVYSNAGAGISVINGGTDNHIYNNTVYANGVTDGYPGIHYILPSTGAVTVRGNICYENSYGGQNQQIVDESAAGATITQSNNLTTNPDFVGAWDEDFRLLSTSDAIGAGYNLSAVFTTDIDGATRTTWDCGCYAYLDAAPMPFGSIINPRIGTYMKRDVAGQKVGAQLVTAAGAAFTGAVTCYVTLDGGTQTQGSVGSGACAHEGNGYHTYAPAQAETNGSLLAYTFVGSGAVPVTVQVYTNYPQSGDNYLNFLADGVCDSGTTTTMVDSARTEADDAWNGNLIYFTTGAVAGQSRVIDDFVASTDRTSWIVPLTASPAGCGYRIIPWG